MKAVQRQMFLRWWNLNCVENEAGKRDKSGKSRILSIKIQVVRVNKVTEENEKK